jgi:hypothetical protein
MSSSAIGGYFREKEMPQFSTREELTMTTDDAKIELTEQDLSRITGGRGKSSGEATGISNNYDGRHHHKYVRPIRAWAHAQARMKSSSAENAGARRRYVRRGEHRARDVETPPAV